MRVRKLSSLPKRKAEFIEPMDRAPVTKLADGPGWAEMAGKLLPDVA